jgi:hypothetical protein
MAEKHTKSNVSRNFALKVAILLQSQPSGGASKLLTMTLEMVEYPYEMTDHLEWPYEVVQVQLSWNKLFYSKIVIS